MSVRGLLAVATVLVLALTVALTFAPRADAALYWRAGLGLDHANLDGSELQHFGADLGISGQIGTPLAAHGGYIYWAKKYPGTIGRVRADGSDLQPTLVNVGTQITSIAVNDDGIYWVNAESAFGPIGRANLDGGNVDPSYISLGTSYAFINSLVATDGGGTHYLFWNAIDNTPPSGDTVIGRHVTNGYGHDPALITFPTDCSRGTPTQLGASTGHILWTDQHCPGNTIGRSDFSGFSVEPHLIGEATAPDAFSVTAAGDHIYWSDTATNKIGRANLDGTAPEEFLTIEPYLTGELVADDFVISYGSPALTKKVIACENSKHVCYLPTECQTSGRCLSPTKVTAPVATTMIKGKTAAGPTRATKKKYFTFAKFTVDLAAGESEDVKFEPTAKGSKLLKDATSGENQVSELKAKVSFGSSKPQKVKIKIK